VIGVICRLPAINTNKPIYFFDILYM
jgi:hypothetical protein